MFISEIKPIKNSWQVNEDIFLSPLQEADAESYWALYEQPLVQRHYESSPFKPGETEAEFTCRIRGLCEHIWTIRKFSAPGIVIGDCALHDWNKEAGEMEIGGVLHPAHWGEGIMINVMKYVINFAAVELGVGKMNAKTSKYNDNAIRLLHKLGFFEIGAEGNTVLFQKSLLN